VRVVPPIVIAPDPPVIFNPVRVIVYVLLGGARLIAYAALPAGSVKVELVIETLPAPSSGLYMAGTPVFPVILILAPVIVVADLSVIYIHGLELLPVENVGLEIVPALLLFIFNVPPATLFTAVFPSVNVLKLMLVVELIDPILKR
jgi:hypothetical protein